jgi:hypothetical protein
VAAPAGTSLRRAALLLAAADLVHALDHVRQDRPLGAEVYGAGIAGWIALAVLLLLIARRHRLAAPYAAAVGASFVAGLVAVHVLPRWGALSDAYPDTRVDAVSWVLLAVPVLAAAALAAAGLRAARLARGRPRASQSYV